MGRLMELISLQGKTNFFEKRVGEYQKAGVMAAVGGKFLRASAWMPTSEGEKRRSFDACRTWRGVELPRCKCLRGGDTTFSQNLLAFSCVNSSAEVQPFGSAVVF